jgi:hypothetical protein
VRRPDGSRAWALDPRAGVRDVPAERIEWDLPAGRVGFASLDGVRPSSPRRTGWHGNRRTADGWESVEVGFDGSGGLRVAAWAPTSPKTRRVVPLSADAALEGPASRRAPGVADGWVLRRADGSATPLASIRPEDGVLDSFGALGPTAVLAFRQPDPMRSVLVPFLLDALEDRERPCSLPEPLAAAGIASLFVAGSTPSGDAVLRVATPDGRYGLALLAVETGAVHTWIPDLRAHSLWCVDDETAIAWVGDLDSSSGALVRVDWRTGTTRRVFPRE